MKPKKIEYRFKRNDLVAIDGPVHCPAIVLGYIGAKVAVVPIWGGARQLVPENKLTPNPRGK